MCQRERVQTDIVTLPIWIQNLTKWDGQYTNKRVSALVRILVSRFNWLVAFKFCMQHSMSHYFLLVKCLQTMIFVPFSLSSFADIIGPFLSNVIVFRVYPLSTPYMLALLAKLHPLSPCTFERKDKIGGRGHWHPTKHTHLCRYCWTKCTH